MYTFPASYTTVANVLEALPAVGSITNITSAVVCSFIGRSEALINAKVSKQYTLPIAGDVPLLQTLSLDITLYNLLAKRIFAGEQLSKSPWPDRYKEALDVLDEIAAGTIPLLTSSGAIVTAGPGLPWSSTMDYLPTMTEDDMTLSLVDSYKIDVIRGDRDLL
jgi:phage gp36-like protein